MIITSLVYCACAWRASASIVEWHCRGSGFGAKGGELTKSDLGIDSREYARAQEQANSEKKTSIVVQRRGYVIRTVIRLEKHS